MTSHKAHIIALPERMDITCASALFDQLHEAEGKCGSTLLLLDVGAVETLTTPCVQLLLAMEKQLVEHGSGMGIENPSLPFTEVMMQLGMETMLQRWSEAGEQTNPDR